MIKCSCGISLLGAIAVSAAPDIYYRQEGVSRSEARADAILEAFQHSWKGYEDNAFGADEVDTVNGSRSYSKYIVSNNSSLEFKDCPGLTYIGDK